MPKPWSRDPEFHRLCDLTAGDNLVCVTGAGISSRLPQQRAPSKTLPGWTDLLKELFNTFKAGFLAEDLADCERLLCIRRAGKNICPSGRDLTLAASVIRSYMPREFDSAFREAVTNSAGSYSETHRALLGLQPAGILTFNYDSGHENAARKLGVKLSPMLPTDEKALRDALVSRKRPFYLKAHGSLSSRAELILTEESYRQVLVKEPAYRAFVQNVLTNYNLVFVGFRINDPDFDLFIDTMARQFGGPLHEHVALFHRNERSSNDISLRRRYGIHLLYVNDFAHIPEILMDAQSIPGPKLLQQLEFALSRDREERERAHRYLSRLGPAGKRCASNSLASQIPQLERAKRAFELSEVAYSLGVIDPVTNKQILIEIVDRATHADPVGRALTVLRPALTPSDLQMLRRWLKHFSKTPLSGDHTDRVPRFLDYLLTYLPAKFRS